MSHFAPTLLECVTKTCHILHLGDKYSLEFTGFYLSHSPNGEYISRKEVIGTQLWLSENIYKSDNISFYGIAAYCAIKTLLLNEEVKTICTTPDILVYQLTHNIHPTRRFYEQVKTGYNELLQNNIIKKIDSSGKYDVLDCSDLFITGSNEYFTIITNEELLKIFQQKNTNTFLLLKYFIYLIGTISSSIDVYIDATQHKCRVVGNLTIGYLSKISGISERSIVEYNKILEDIGLLYIYRHNDFLINSNNGEIKKIVNAYGRPEDKKYIDSFAINQEKYKKSHKYMENNIVEANNKRRLAQMYNQICKNNDSKYSEEDIKRVYAYVLQENHKYEVTYKNNNNKTYLKKIRDVRVFDKYNFITKEEN